MTHKRTPSALSILVLVVVVGLAGGSWWVLQRSVEQQDQALLKNDTSQVVLLLQTAVQNLGSQLSALGTATVDSGNSTTVFDQQAKPIVVQPTASVALVNTSLTPPRVILAAGADLHRGEQLTGPLAAAVLGARPVLSGSKVVRVGTKDFLLFTEVPPATAPGVVVLETNDVQPGKPAASTNGPYSQLDVALYATATPQPGQLITSALGDRPLPRPTASSVLRVGTLSWDVVGAAKAPLVGTAANLTPWIVLGTGALLALVLFMTVEALVRRQRHTAQMVTEREAELLEAQGLLLRQERLSAVGEMATVIGHELRNPLGAAINALYLVRNKVDKSIDPQAEAYLALAEREINRAAALSEDLTAYMRERMPLVTQFDLRDVVDAVLESTPPPAGITVSPPDRGCDLDADKDQITQVLINLVTNAYQVMPGGGSLSITGSQVDGLSEISVVDSGEGVDPADAERLFDPFFTTRSIGTGLGLAIVKRIVESHAGTVTIGNGPSGGAVVTFRLPRKAEGAAR